MFLAVQNCPRCNTIPPATHGSAYQVSTLHWRIAHTSAQSTEVHATRIVVRGNVDVTWIIFAYLGLKVLIGTEGDCAPFLNWNRLP